MGNLADLLRSGSHGKLLLDKATLLSCARVRLDTVAAHEVEQLTWNFIKNLLGKHVWIVLKLVEGHKLDDISRHILAVCTGVKGLFIAVKHLHGGEVSIANTNDDDGKWKVRATYDFIDSLLHIIDDTIGKDQQDVILLVVLGYVRGLSIVIRLG